VGREEREARVTPVLQPWLRAQAINVTRHASALRSFRRDEFGTGAAAPTEAHLQAANALISSLRKDLLGLTKQVSSATDAAIREPTSARMQRVVSQKERAHSWVQAIERIWDFYFELFGQRQSQPIQLHVPTYARSSAFAPMSWPVPQAGRMVSDGESVRRGPLYMEMLKKLETLACDLEPKVPARLKARLARVIDEIQQQHCRVQASAGVGGAASARVLCEIANRWHGLCPSLSAILTSAKDASSPVQKKELTDWETRLSSLQPRTQDAIGYQPAFSDAMASERGACAP